MVLAVVLKPPEDVEPTVVLFVLLAASHAGQITCTGFDGNRDQRGALAPRYPARF